MAKRTTDVQVGLFAVIGLLLLGMLILIFGGFKNFLAETYAIAAHFPNAAGTTEGTPVRLLGIEVGRVKNITLAHDQGGVLMILAIQKSVDIRADAPISIKQEGFIANIYLEFSLGTSPAVLPKDGTARVEGRVETFAQYVEDAASALRTMGTNMNARVTEVSDRLVKLADNLNDITGDEQFRKDLKVLAANTGAVTSELKQKLPELIANLNSTATKAQASIEKASELFETYRNLGEELQQTDAIVKEQVTRQGANLDKVTGSLVEAADNIAKLSASLNDIAEAVKTGRGSMGQLFTNEDLYRKTVSLVDTLTNASKEFGDLAETLRRHPDWVIKGPPKGSQ